MNLKSLANAVTSRAGRQILKVSKHSPVLLFSAGVVGVVGTVVLASRATLKIDEIMDETDYLKVRIEDAYNSSKMSDEDYRHDQILLRVQTSMKIARLYAPAIGLGVLSIAALTGSHVILTRRNVALTAAYAALDRGFRQYRDRVSKELGADKDREFRYGLTEREIVEETKNGPKTKVVKDVVTDDLSIYARVFDETSTSWSKVHMQNQFFLQCQQNYANDLLNKRGHVFLNEIYDMLGLSRTKAGQVVGWVKDNPNGGDSYIDFGVFKGDKFHALRFVNGEERSIWLDFNVDGNVLDLI